MDSQVDPPTFIAFLMDVESPYEIQDYVKSYVGETKEALTFAKQFVEKRSKYKQQEIKAKKRKEQEDALLGPVRALNPVSAKSVTTIKDDAENNNDFTVATGGKGKKGKKGKKMQKVDSSILGFTVHAENDAENNNDFTVATGGKGKKGK